MKNKFLALSGLAGLGTGISAVIGGGLGVLAGIGVTILFFIYTILPWAQQQTVRAPEWYGVAIIMGLVPTIVVLVVAVLVGAVLGGLLLGLLAFLVVAGTASLVSLRRKA